MSGMAKEWTTSANVQAKFYLVPIGSRLGICNLWGGCQRVIVANPARSPRNRLLGSNLPHASCWPQLRLN
jgi:hypothetical protein